MARNLYQNVTDRIISKLETGTVPWVRPYSQTPNANVPMNAISNRPYSGINVLLFWIAAERGWATPRFLTYRQAKAAGGQVRKNEHGIPLYFFKQLIVKDNKTEKDKRIPLLREYTVFNVAQCDRLPDSIVNGKIAAGPANIDQRHTDAETFIVDTGASIKENNGNGMPMYVPSMDYISMPPFKDFKSSPYYYGTMFHELGHWTGAKSRLDRDFSGRFGTQAYAAEELVAELTAAFLCAEFGIDNEQQNASYITSWIKLLKEDSRAIFTAASKAQAAASYLKQAADYEQIDPRDTDTADAELEAA